MLIFLPSGDGKGFNGYLFFPTDPIIEKDMQEGEAEKAAQGVRVRIGKQIRSFLRQVGFVRTEGSASYDSYGTPESVHRLVYGLSPTAGEPENEVDAAWRRWAASTDAFFGHALCEGLGWKE